MKLKRQKTQNVKLPLSTVDKVRKFARDNSTPNGKVIIGRFVNNAILEKLEREESNFQIKP